MAIDPGKIDPASFIKAKARLVLPRNGNGLRRRLLSDRMQEALDNERKAGDKGNKGWINLMARWTPEVRRLEIDAHDVSSRTFIWGVVGGAVIVLTFFVLAHVTF
jgi:hypothetical protein